MYMTDYQKNIYNNWKLADQAEFAEYVEEHPNCTFQEAADYIATLNGTKVAITSGTIRPGDKINEDPKILKAILEGAKRWYNQYAKPLWEKVEDSFENALNYLDNLIARGVKWIGNKIAEGIEWLIELLS